MTRAGPTTWPAAVRAAVRPADLLALLAVPAILVAIFALPEATRRAFTFDYADPTLATAFAAPFVHLEATHLLTNLLGYALVVTTVFLLCALSGHRRRFYVAGVTFLVAFPAVLSYLNLAIARPGVTYGFSGVLMAFLGLLPIALATYLRETFDVPAPLDVAGGLFFVGLGLVAVLTVQAPVTYGLAAAALLAAALFLLSALETAPPRPDVRAALSTAGFLELAVLGFVTFVAFTFVAFPLDPTVDGGVLNLYVHLLGYALGFTATYAATHLDAHLPGHWETGIHG